MSVLWLIISVSPIGRIVLSAHNITYSDGLNGTSMTHLSPQQLITSLGHVTDEFDQTSVENCFLLSSRDQSEIAMEQTGSTAIQSVQIYFKIPKFVSHVQILAPNYPNGMPVWFLFCQSRDANVDYANFSAGQAQINDRV